VPYRRLSAIVQRSTWSLPSPRRTHGGHAPALPPSSVRWLRLLAGVMVMAALFAVLISAAEPERAAAGPTGGAASVLAIGGITPAR
jgi:hypothetical protein